MPICPKLEHPIRLRPSIRATATNSQSVPPSQRPEYLCPESVPASWRRSRARFFSANTLPAEPHGTGTFYRTLRAIFTDKTRSPQPPKLRATTSLLLFATSAGLLFFLHFSRVDQHDTPAQNFSVHNSVHASVYVHISRHASGSVIAPLPSRFACIRRVRQRRHSSCHPCCLRAQASMTRHSSWHIRIVPAVNHESAPPGRCRFPHPSHL